MFILLHASCPSRYLPQINSMTMLGLDLHYFLLKFTYIIQHVLEQKAEWPNYLFFLIEVSVSFKDRKCSRLFLCKYSNLNFYWQEHFLGNFLVNPLMNVLWQMEHFCSSCYFCLKITSSLLSWTERSCCQHRLIVPRRHVIPDFSAE